MKAILFIEREYEIEVEISGDCTPEERETRDSPGYPASYEIESTINKDTGKEIELTPEETKEALVALEEAFDEQEGEDAISAHEAREEWREMERDYQYSRL